MTVVQYGTVNTTALNVPDLYVQIQPPNNNYINGVPTDKFGLVGIASWGPVNSPTTAGSLSQQVQNMGPVLPVKYDLATQVALAGLQGANNFLCVRVTDGTDTAATIPVVDTAGTPVTGLTITAMYTGTVGNTVVVRI